MSKAPDDKFSDKETKLRFEAALRGARLVGHRPLKDIPKRNGESRVDRAAKKVKKRSRK
jgi:hypothetical protein